MSKGSDNAFPSILLVEQGSTPANPSAGDQRLFLKTSDHLPYLVNSSGTVTAVGGSGGSLTSSMAQLSGNVTMTNANQYYDGPSLSLAAGTWLVTAVITALSPGGTGGQHTGKLWDGTTAFASSEVKFEAVSTVRQIVVSGLVVLGSTTTIKVSCANDNAGFVMLATVNANATGITNMASTLVALKVA